MIVSCLSSPKYSLPLEVNLYKYLIVPKLKFECLEEIVHCNCNIKIPAGDSQLPLTKQKKSLKKVKE